MSSRSNYSLYAPYVSGSQNKSSSGSTQPPSGGKEAEVDALTDLLVQSMDGSADSDIYGMLRMSMTVFVSRCDILNILFFTLAVIYLLKLCMFVKFSYKRALSVSPFKVK
jgi:hypothetical protein